METKNKLQQEIVDTFLANPNNSRGSIIVPTGVGKTRIALIIAKALFDEGKISSCLIITPTKVLKEDSWPREIDIMGMNNYNITIECKQTACKFTSTWGAVLIDEAHLAMSPVHGKVLDLECNYMLGLTATEPKHNNEYLDILHTRLPILFKITLKECIELGIVPQSNVFNLSVKLNRSERGKYTLFDRMFNSARSLIKEYCKANGVTDSEFDLANKYGKTEHRNHPLYKIAKSYWSAMSMRKWVCYRAESKVPTCIEIIRKSPTKKWIVFSKEIEFVETLARDLNDINIKSVAYHSKMLQHDREAALEAIRDPLVSVIVSAEALNVGYNLPELDAAICASGVSTELSGIQTLGQPRPILV